ncbi:putative lipid II flippase FtsW [Myxococcota bacterium]|nr:putative lipid II flippase FtsW [Myxococcota bacterium]MCZ7620209.1 putative lipid II flippase FtsW [Myxococcota bacterium]
MSMAGTVAGQAHGKAPARLAAPHGGVVAATAVLACVGLIMVWSTTSPLALDAPVPPHFLRHLAGLVAGVVLAGVCMLLPLSAWRRLALPLWALCIGLLVLTLVAGTTVNGAQRWLSIPGVGPVLQPVELAKWATLLATAVALAREPSGRRRKRFRLPASGLVLLLVSLPAALVFLQPDTKGALLLLILVGLQLFVSGTPIRAFAIPIGLATAVLGLAITMRPYVMSRVLAFLDPWANAQASGFQLVQSFVAFGRGGFAGVGLGNGRQKLFYLPEAHTDFVLSVVAEELGLLGVTLVLGAFAALLVAGVRIAARTQGRFAFLVAFSMTAVIAVPAAVNAAVVMGMVPPTGLTLPFVSYGRSSLLLSFAAIGVLLGISRREGAPREPATDSSILARRSRPR